MMLLRQLLTSVFAIQWVGWLAASLLRTEKFYDLTGSLTFVYIVLRTILYSRSCTSWRQKLQAGCVLVWTIRLGGFLFYRVLFEGGDRRFDEIKRNWIKFFVAWTLQGVWISASLYPSIRLWEKDETTAQLAFSYQDGFGYSIWLLAWLLEAVADIQKYRFKRNPANKDKWIDEGVWRIVRHPNYLGEIVIWYMLWLTASQTFTSPWEYLTVLCPTFNAVLIIFISGIPPQAKRGMEKWGHLPEYQEYLSKRYKLIPFVF
uniref:Steroid 5-alpha reductase C-terminal domain-containing protein n=1 Tax=Plectus sambesii TaxID=2011161 RepID=A0A914XL74_9BILA